MSDGVASKQISLSIDGRLVQAHADESLIEVMDRLGIAVPRFCYHPDLSVVASCRMCLVEVENSPKLLPSCATRVCEGMKVHTCSEKTKMAQSDVMQFLLINHPLDCPVCDQGGECDLQDLAVYGKGSSSFFEEKRVLPNLQLGPLIQTHMNRCIQCSRCVRFMDEIAGQRELSWMGRGDTMHIESVLEKGMYSPLSGNIVDVCPVGALTAKPSAMQGRSWSYRAYASVSPHDCMGSQLWWHVRQISVNECAHIMRVVPRHTPEINHAWLSNRDRYSYVGYQKERLLAPKLKIGKQWHEITWDDVYAWIGQQIGALTEEERHHALALTGLHTTMEEGYYLQMWWRQMGFLHLLADVRVSDDRDRGCWQGAVVADMSWTCFENYGSIYVLGGDLLHELPLFFSRLLKAKSSGVRVSYVGNLEDSMPDIPTIHIRPSQWVNWLMRCDHKNAHLLEGHGSKVLIVLSTDVWHHSESALIRAIVEKMKDTSHGSLDWMQLTDGPNASGLHAVGCSSMRDHLGLISREKQGMPVQEIHKGSPKFVWMHGLDGLHDTSFPQSWLNDSTTLIAAHYYDDPYLREHATLMLPIAHLPEIRGHYCSLTAHVSSWSPVLTPMGASLSGEVLYQNLLKLTSMSTVLDFSTWMKDFFSKNINGYRMDGSKGTAAYDRLVFQDLPRWNQSRADPLSRRASVLAEAMPKQTLGLDARWVDQNIGCGDDTT